MSAGQLRSLVLARVKANPGQPRKLFDEDAMEELRASIRAHGLLQPITVREMNGGYQLVAGERRWRACNDLKMKRIPAMVLQLEDAPAYMASISENVTRQDMTVMEEAGAYAEAVALGLPVEEIALQLGKRPADIRGRIELLRLTPMAQDAVAKGLMRPNLAWYLSKLVPDGQAVVLRRWARGEFRTDDDGIEFCRVMQAAEDQVVLFGEQPTLETEQARERMRKQAMSTIERVHRALVEVGRLGEIDPVELAEAMQGDMAPLRRLADEMTATASVFAKKVRTADAFLAARQELTPADPT